MFQQLVYHLPRWDITLLCNFCFGATTRPQLLSLFQNPEVELILSLHGGAKDCLGTFGALLASQTDNHNSSDAILVA
jgi:hypothetical protein